MSFSSFLTRILVRSGIAQVLPGIDRWSEGSQDFLHYYSDQVLQAPREELRNAASLITPTPPDMIDLSQGTPKLESFTKALTTVEPRRESYPLPWGSLELRQILATQLSTLQNQSVDPETEVLVTPGAAGALQTVLSTFTNPGDRVVLFDPTSPLFPLSLRAQRLRIHWLYSRTEDGVLRFQLEQLSKALRRARLMILPPIGSPTGGLLAPDDLEQIIWWAHRYDVLLYADESYANYHYEGVRVLPHTFERSHKRILTAGSVSKSHGLASLRVGWLSGHQHLIRPCMLTMALKTSFVPTICQQVAMNALKEGEGALSSIRRELANRRLVVAERLQQQGYQVSTPASGLFFWIPTQNLSGSAFADALMKDKQVQVAPGDLFGPSGKNYVRLCFAGEEGRLREGLRRMEEQVSHAV